MKELLVVGAGLSGMVAALELARKGHRVRVRDGAEGPGLGAAPYPSVHTTSIDLEATSLYLDLDLSDLFTPVRICPFLLGSQVLHPPLHLLDLHSVERGPRPGSLDLFLYRACLEAGVSFEFESPLVEEELVSLPSGTILACGLNPRVYRLLGLPFVSWHGLYRTSRTDEEGISRVWVGRGVSEYGYLSTCRDLAFELIFSQQPVGEMEATWYEEETGSPLRGGWRSASGAVPLASPHQPRLFHRRFILAGTLSGAMDPFFWFGICGALVGGKIAALAIHDPERAEREFAAMTRGFATGWWAKRFWYLLRRDPRRLQRIVERLGPRRIEGFFDLFYRRYRFPFRIPGFGRLGNMGTRGRPPGGW